MTKKSVKLDIGTIYQKEDGGMYYFRYQINGKRKAVSLKTKNLEEAKREASKQLPILQATTTEVIAAHVQHARGLIGHRKSLLLADAWQRYCDNPDRATPATVSEVLSYQFHCVNLSSGHKSPRRHCTKSRILPPLKRVLN